MECIYLTKEQADKVRGRQGKYSMLEPIDLGNDTFMLPMSVLRDNEHKEAFKELEKAQTVDIEIVKSVDTKKSIIDKTKETISYNITNAKAFPAKAESMHKILKLKQNDI